MYSLSIFCLLLINSHLGIVAVYEERLDGVKDEDEELNHLELGQDVFPAQVWLGSRTQGGQEVVAVHQHVDAAVEKPTERGVASSNKLGGIIKL